MSEEKKYNNQEALKAHQFKPGKSGNPKGKPKGAINMTTILKAMLNEKVEVLDGNKLKKKKFADVLVRKLIQKANAGDIKAIQEIWNRLEGKPAQSLDITTDGAPIQPGTQQVIIENPHIKRDEGEG